MNHLNDTWVSGSIVNFNYQKEAQKPLIEFILNYSCYDLYTLAELLEIEAVILRNVLNSKCYLKPIVALKLINWFLVLISE
ncbi:hypothetical protein A6J40_01910 [Legionella longbeachae]|uniref:hypothetical protein n=1 Tax=Legionella longbeachae TaxID=450 RepID=UPI0009B75179|nr:hypothetical protein [Legionella longbeachae]VEE02721.1 Uncharacterised protein [Legionella oakridgensis]ARB91016.1 hypothetical protein A6J40_01910 [Legionella longbeachae]ARM32557.1 hypothetical protein B0B39_03005 [Legionella longbeachae]RZV21192.1 hypothetical protein EKG34_17230 [Legionella longbeachae]UAK45783.1 hypothetical protein K8O86_13450 [Legionella longbeachae]